MPTYLSISPISGRESGIHFALEVFVVVIVGESSSGRHLPATNSTNSLVSSDPTRELRPARPEFPTFRSLHFGLSLCSPPDSAICNLSRLLAQTSRSFSPCPEIHAIVEYITIVSFPPPSMSSVSTTAPALRPPLPNCNGFSSGLGFPPG
ncbi:hypothetical protein CBS63078_7492 [Aspergillus niger]|nr:hypothetical protein CBS115989_7096 [Aspergillus niger]KAI2827410.1 hypothetical protein CBS133816_6519 [Aspergillus niger]KAI2842276.1 hypothetical protein CBS11350_5888 [Aspergillus niger]KAI2849305.1 hypothetical protein CBS11232_6657 [Aspergillus niger]KAI2859126.1 hypothetical protein CBS12448_5825 [Aspergillus niger]